MVQCRANYAFSGIVGNIPVSFELHGIFVHIDSLRIVLSAVASCAIGEISGWKSFPRRLQMNCLSGLSSPEHVWK